MAVIGGEMAVIYRRGLLKLYVNIAKGDSHSLRRGGCRFFENEEQILYNIYQWYKILIN